MLHHEPAVGRDQSISPHGKQGNMHEMSEAEGEFDAKHAIIKVKQIGSFQLAAAVGLIRH